MWSFQGRSTQEWIIWVWWQVTNKGPRASRHHWSPEWRVEGVKTVIEAIQRLVFERFAEKENVKIYSPGALLNLVQIRNSENLDLTLLDPLRSPSWRCASYKDRMHNDYLEMTARFWPSERKHIRLILMLQYSVKVNNFPLFHKCHMDMAHLFIAWWAKLVKVIYILA